MQRRRLRLFHDSPLELLFGFLLLMMIGGFALYAWNTWNHIHERSEAELRFLDRLLIQTTREIFTYHESMLHVLGERLQEAGALEQPERGRALIDQMLRLNPAMAGFGLARADGQLVLVSGVPAGVSLPNLLQNPKSASGFRKALEHDGLVPGRTYYLPLLDSWVVPMRIAIRDADKQVSMVMTSGFDLNSPATAWNILRPASGTRLGLLREDGYWQYAAPVAPEERTAVYEQPASAGDIRRIRGYHRQARAGTGFYINDSLAVSSWLPRWRLYTLVTRGNAAIAAEYRQAMRLPIAIFILLIASGYAFYRISRHQQREYENRLIRQAQYDDLTGLPNRLLMTDRLGQALEMARRKQQQVALAFLDLDLFKRINDSFGHMVGDELLRQFARRLNGILRAGDTVSRLGGDEFLLILPGISDTGTAEAVIRKIHRLCQQPFLIENREIYSTCSIGLSLYPDDGATPADLLKAADTALYRAKEQGRNTHCFYSEEMNRQAQRQMQLESALRHALENEELYLLYQPQVDLASNRWCGCEALLRWRHPELGEIPPLEFIPLAEQTGLIHEIGRFVLQQACADLAMIRRQWPYAFRMAVNVSAWQIHASGLPGQIEELLHTHLLPGQALELEITENSVVEHGEHLESLHALGLSIAIDDFGTGFCSLSYLQRFPIDTLKIDRAFVRNVALSRSEADLARAIVNLGQSLELHIVAEGIETAEQLAYLKRVGCQTGQGYYFSHPLPVETLFQRLRDQYRQLPD